MNKKINVRRRIFLAIWPSFHHLKHLNADEMSDSAENWVDSHYQKSNPPFVHTTQLDKTRSECCPLDSVQCHNDCHEFRFSTVWNVNSFTQVHMPCHSLSWYLSLKLSLSLPLPLSLYLHWSNSGVFIIVIVSKVTSL